ncbi:hypothetical protein, partial [Streptomyces sp. UG1]|uniref:hypothetical protein n=1 Tax=Streptomyces sp. UG1 TaxID=3417652 RepID=UPI003CF2C372
RGRGFFFPILSMMDIILLGPKPLIFDVRQSGSSPASNPTRIPLSGVKQLKAATDRSKPPATGRSE